MCAATPGLEAVQIPYRNEASAIGETVGIPDATYSFDLETNSFAINDDGLVVGAYGLPLDPCSAATAFGQQNPVRARAFVWIPASYTALPAFVPRGQVLDLHTLGALPADGRSIAVDVSRTSAWVTGSSGYPFSLNSKAWAWNLAAAVSSGGSLTSIPATDLHPLLGNAEPAQPESALAGDRSIGTAVRHEAGDAYPIFVGSFTHACGDQPERWKGFRLRLDQLPDTTSLWGMPLGGFKSSARDIAVHPNAETEDDLFIVGGSYDCWGATLDPCDGPFGPCSQSCFSSHRFGGVWFGPWDDNDENPLWTVDELPFLRDRVDEVLPPIEYGGNIGSDGFRAEVRVNRANAVGELAGVGARDHTDTVPPTPGVCRHRAGFWWYESMVGWQGWDIDRQYASLQPFAVSIQSRAFGLSQRTPNRPVLLVGGEDNTAPFPRAVCWCGYGSNWERSFVAFSGAAPNLVPRVRWDELNVDGAMDAAYGLDLAAWQIESVHDVNALGQMVILLRGNSIEAGDRAFPAILTIAPDINGDFLVSGPDLASVIADWGAVPTGLTSTQSDLDGDGQVGSTDLATLLGAWGTVADLHPFFCSAGLAGLAGETNESQLGVEITESGVDAALALLGLTDITALQTWLAGATPEQVQALGEVLVALARAGDTPTEGGDGQ